MFYAARGSVPPTRHTQHRARRWLALRRGAVRRRGVHRSLVAALPPRPADADAPDRTRRRPSALEEADDGYHHHRLIDAAGVELARRRGHRAASRCSSTATSSWASSARPTRCRTATFYRNGEADELLFVHEGEGLLDTVFGPTPLRPGRLPGPADRDDVAARAGRRSAQRMLYLECPSEIEAPKRYRNDYGQLLEHSPYSQRDIRVPDEVAAADRRGRLHGPRQDARPADRLPLQAPPVRRRRLGRLSLAVRLQHRRLPADHRAGPPAATGPPDVRGAELRGVLVRAAQVRLPPAGDPGAVQPLEHQLGRGHLLRGRQLHEPPRGRDLVVHAPSGGDPARAAPGDRGSVDRQGGHRGAGRDGRHLPSAAHHDGKRPPWRTTATRIRGCRPRTPPARPASSAERGPEAFPD